MPAGAPRGTGVDRSPRLTDNPAAMRRTPPLLSLFCLAAAACAGMQTQPPSTPQDLARAAHESAEETFEGGNYLEAVREYQEIKTKHPYSAFAPLSELRLGDCQFEMGKFLEAVEIYRAFVRFHPHHERVGYARFRIGESYFREMPEEWVFMPPAHEKDQAATRDAVRALRRYLKKHAGHAREAEAAKMLNSARRRLAQHERYVADFYLQRQKPQAGALRLERLVERYADVGLAEDALLTLGRVYRDQLDAPDKAYDAFRRMVELFPGDERAALAREALKALPAPASPEAPEATEPPPETPSAAPGDQSES